MESGLYNSVASVLWVVGTPGMMGFFGGLLFSNAFLAVPSFPQSEILLQHQKNPFIRKLSLPYHHLKITPYLAENGRSHLCHLGLCSISSNRKLTNCG